MEIPYSALLRMAFALWWRYYVLWFGIVVMLAAPLLIASWFVPQFQETLAASRIDRDFFLLGALPVFEGLIAFPMAVRWFRKECASAFGVEVAYRGTNEAMQANPQRQQILFGWSVFFMPLAWEVVNALLIHGLFAGSPESLPVWASIVAIYANLALLQLLAFLPMNLNWVFHNRFAGVEWKLAMIADEAGDQGR